MKTMKRNISLMTILVLFTFCVTAQNDNMFIMKSGFVIGKYNISTEVDSIIFYEPTSTNTMTDIEGNVYKTVTIGNQVWMAENLKTTKYNDGSSIPCVTDATQWSKISTGAYCNFDDFEINADSYGRLYNWYTINTPGKQLAPAGWHVPTDEDWTILENYVAANLENSESVAKALAANINWISDWRSDSELGAIGNDLTKNNSTGFTALPTSDRSYYGDFGLINHECSWWSSTKSDMEDQAWSRTFNYISTNLGRYSSRFKRGSSIRLVKD